MKKPNLTATFAGCSLCVILTAGATAELQPCYIDVGNCPSGMKTCVEGGYVIVSAR